MTSSAHYSTPLRRAQWAGGRLRNLNHLLLSSTCSLWAGTACGFTQTQCPVELTPPWGQAQGEEILETPCSGQEESYCRAVLPWKLWLNWYLQSVRSQGAFTNEVSLPTVSILALCVDGISSSRDLPMQVPERSV